MSETQIEKELIANLASVKEDRFFIKSVFTDLDSDEKKKEMIRYIKENRENGISLSMSDVYLKEMLINGKIIE